MGVQRLQTYIQKYKLGNNISLTKYNYKRIIVDGDSVAFYLYEKSNLPRIYGGEYFGLKNYLFSFFKKFKNKGFDILVVFDGIPPNEKRGVINERRKTKFSSSIDLLSKIEKGIDIYNQHIPITRPNFLKNVLSEVLKELDIPVQHSIGENDDYIVKLIQENSFDAVLAKDTDFLIYNIKAYIPINQLSFKDDNILCTVINNNHLCRHFKMQKKFLPLFAYLAGNDVSNGSSDIYNIIQKYHMQFKPYVLKNIAKQIVYNMQQTMQFLFQDINLLEGLTRCYRKYNLLFEENNDFNSLPYLYQKNFKNMTLDTDVVILFLKNSKCYTATFLGIKICIPKKLQPLRKNFYAILFGANYVISEYLWEYNNNEISWIKSLVESNSHFANKEKNITNFLACLDIKISFLDIIPKNLQVISIAILLLKRNTEYSKNDLFCLFYHICNINSHTDVDIFKLIYKDTLNKKSLEIVDSYMFCLNEVIFFNQAFLNILDNTKLSLFCRASLFYAYHNSHIEVKTDNFHDNIFKYIMQH